MINYQISLIPNENQFAVILKFIPITNNHTLKLPTWIPGSYMIREFSKNINKLAVQQVGNTSLTFTQTNKNTWDINNLNVGAELEVSYNVYAYDFGIRTAYLDNLRGYFNNTSICLYVIGLENLEHRITLENIPPKWQVETSLKKEALNHFVAANYDELIDSPFELGQLKIINFTVANTLHHLVLSGNIIAGFDEARVINDLQKICEYQINMFGGIAPFSHYRFLLHLGGEIYTGLEHKSSTALMAPYYSLPIWGDTTENKEYIKLLGLISHEYFHSWNVKRIKPQVFTPYDLDNENYTSLLWWFEGVTSYYDDLVLYRTGIISQAEYLQIIVDNINSVYKYEGVNTQTLSNSSKTAWIKYYRQDENSPNSVVSYYIKGSLVAMCLDLLIRQETGGVKNLDHVLLELYKKWCHDQNGIGEDELFKLINQYSNCNLNKYLESFINTCEPLPLVELFKKFGLDQLIVEGHYSQSGKIYTDKIKDLSIDYLKYDLGFKLNKEVLGYRVTNIYTNTPASISNLAPYDLIIAINHIKLDNWEKQFALFQNSDSIILTVFRRTQLLEIEINLKQSQKCQIANLKVLDQSLLSNWL